MRFRCGDQVGLDLADHDHRLHLRACTEKGSKDTLMLGEFHDHCDRVGVGEDVLELGGCVPVVHVDRDRTDLDQPEDRRDMFDAVLQEQGYMIAARDAGLREQVGRSVGFRVQLSVGEVLSLVSQGDAIRHRAGDGFEYISEVELHRLPFQSLRRDTEAYNPESRTRSMSPEAKRSD